MKIFWRNYVVLINLGISQLCIPNAAELVKLCFSSSMTGKQSGIVDAIVIMSKLFTLTQHQAVGPKVIDPIIIEENKISPRYLSQMVALHIDSILCPAIIIILRDNDFNRAKDLLSQCPNGINAKLIRNGGKSEIYKVINTGAKDIEGFIDLYGKQSFSTCSCTSRNIINNVKWNEVDFVHRYATMMFQIRSSLLIDDKSALVSNHIDELLRNITSDIDANNERIVKTFILITK